MKLKKKLQYSIIILVIICCLLVSVINCGGVITGSGKLETWVMDYENFNKLDIHNAFQVDIIRSDSFSVEITADDNLFEFLDIRQRGNTLNIGFKWNYVYRNTTQSAIITMPSIEGLDLSGASKGTISSFTSSERFEIDLSGASSLDLDSLQAGDTYFDISGASSISGSIETADSYFDLSGASTAELSGSTIDTILDLSGASNAKLANFVISDARVNLSGASRATINASGRLDLDLSGGSRLTYLGSPKLGRLDISGGSSINQG